MVIHWVFGSKKFVKFSVVLSNTCISAWLYVSSGSFQRWSLYECFVCLCCTYVGFLSKKKPQSTSGVTVVCSGLERIGNSMKIRKNTRLCEGIESSKVSLLSTFFGVWQMRHFLTNLFQSFKSCIRARFVSQGWH